MRRNVTLRSGGNQTPYVPLLNNPEQNKVYEIMKKTKLRVLAELKTKMITMLNPLAKEELEIEAQM